MEMLQAWQHMTEERALAKAAEKKMEKAAAKAAEKAAATPKKATEEAAKAGIAKFLKRICKLWRTFSDTLR